MARDPELVAHQEWLGYIQPVGLVVSAPALLQAQAHVNSNVIPQHQRFLACLPVDKDDEVIPQIEDFTAFVRQVLDWSDTDLVAFDDAHKSGIDVSGLEVVLPEYNETLRPTWIVPEFMSAGARPVVSSGATATPATATSSAEPAQPSNADRFVMLIQQVPNSQDLDEPQEETDRRWHASPHARFERLLRETQVPAGLLTNGRNLRLVYSPRGETSGYLTFNVDEMTTVAGRPIFAAFHMLLNADRLFNLEKKQRLPAILSESRKYQNTVSTKLAQQVMAALYEFLRGFQAADDQWNGRLLKDVLAQDPQHVYHGLVTVLLRSVFILYAEDRNLLSNHPVYTNYYSITGLFERLRADAGQYPDTMDQRYGAWAQLLTLFRMIYEGGKHGEFSIPPRKGYLFDPERYPFLEGLGIGGLGLGKDIGAGDSGLGTGVDEVEATSDDVVSERRADFLTTKPIASPSSTIPQPQIPSPQLTPKPHSLIPRISDGVIFRVLNNLLILDGERLSYRSLDVEQIGSVYEAIMGFEVQVSDGRSIAIKPVKKHGAPATINLDELLSAESSKRAEWLKSRTDQSFTGRALEALKSARTIEDLLAALDRKIDNLVTPNVVSANAMIFQPSDERRRSGSHYTPRSFTEPIVRKTLKPILDQFGPHPRPEQILALKICDPAMGSGAFLVEVCRQLAEALVAAWYYHDCVPLLPPDEDELLHARRVIAQHCLYGVDKNPMAVDLAKLSLWLVTLAKDHPFTFVDHSLRCGDSLVGLTREQIVNFTWETGMGVGESGPAKRGKKPRSSSSQSPIPNPQSLFRDPIAERMRTVTEYRQRILAARDDKPYEQLRQELDVADDALSLARLTGDCIIAAFFSAGKDRERFAKLDTLARQLVQYLGPQRRIEDRQPLTDAVASLRGELLVASSQLLGKKDSGDPVLTTNDQQLTTPPPSIAPFHWQIEFPEVFTVDANGKPTGGFDAIVGNPPFAGKNTLINGNREGYLDWLKTLHEESHGNADLVAHFFRRAFNLLRTQGCFGLIATNTIGQGDTRSTGLRWICMHEATIFAARKRVKWPGLAAVIVSVVHVCRGTIRFPLILDGREVPIITAYLFHAGGHEDPNRLSWSTQHSFKGCDVYGMGFTFDDDPAGTAASSVSRLRELLENDPTNSEVIFPFIGGEELNGDPSQNFRRYVIHFGSRSESEARQWPALFRIVEERVKPERMALRDTADAKRLKERWWQFSRPRPELQEAKKGLSRIIAISEVTPNCTFAFVPTTWVPAHTLKLFTLDTFSAIAVIQSRIHEYWARFFGSSLKDDLRYTPSDCFETFPFPDSFATNDRLETAGREYYEFRAALMVRNNEGLTKTYNRFHDPHETSPDILQLRALHAAMDRAVLEAYGWHDLAQTATCEFLLDYEDDEDEDEGAGARSPGTGRQKKKPWRYRWPDDFRDEVLARLLELNKQRHQEELLTGSSQLIAKKEPKASKKPSKSKKATPGQSLPGFDDVDE